MLTVAGGTGVRTPLLQPSFILSILRYHVLLLVFDEVMNLRECVNRQRKSLMIPVYLHCFDAVLVGIWFLSNFSGHMPYTATAHLKDTIRGVIDSLCKGPLLQVLPH